MQRLSTREDDPSVRIPRNRSSRHLGGTTLGFDAASLRLLSPQEVEKFLDLIFKHHPEPMTAESMRQSVDALYSDWAQYCAQRQVPVKLAKKPLMDEYAKIFNGVYGPSLQDKARSIAQELSNGRRMRQRMATPRATRGRRRERARVGAARHPHQWTRTAMRTPAKQSTALRTRCGSIRGRITGARRRKGQEEHRSGGPQRSRGASPGLFDILRNHLRDDILSSIMPSVRTDLTEQTRELFPSPNQDSLWASQGDGGTRAQPRAVDPTSTRSRPADGASPHVGPGHGPPLVDAGLAGADAAAGMAAKPRPFLAATRDPAGLVRHARHAASSSDHEFWSIDGRLLWRQRAIVSAPRGEWIRGLRTLPACILRSHGKVDRVRGVEPAAGTVRGQAPPFATGRREPEARACRRIPGSGAFRTKALVRQRGISETELVAE